MTVESARSTAAYTSVFVFLVLVSFQLQGCSNGGNSAAMMSGACEGWCEGDQWTVENGQSHKERHCGGDMSSLCGGCDYCPGGNGGDSNDDAAGSSGDCCTNCAGRAYCSPQSLQCHDEKPWNKDYYLDCGGSGSGDASGSDGGDDCCNHCTGYAHCSPQSGQCHDEKPWNKDYYLDCGGSGSDSGGSVPRRRRRRISGGSSGGKGGVAVNSDNVATAGNWLDGKLRWAHGWYPSQNYNTPSGVTYIPQFAQTHEFSQSVPSDATYVLCFNEPNAGDLHGAQGMSVSDAVGLFKQLRAKTQAKIILGNFAVTDTMETWYNEFKSACSGCQWEAVGIHPYDAYPMSHVERIRKYADGKEIWLTEWNAGSGDHAALIRETVPTLEKDTQIGGYLWFSQNAPISGDIAAAFNEVL